MHRVFVVFLVLALALLIVGCGGSTATTSTTAAAASSTTVSTTSTASDYRTKAQALVAMVKQASQQMSDGAGLFSSDPSAGSAKITAAAQAFRDAGDAWLDLPDAPSDYSLFDEAINLAMQKFTVAASEIKTALQNSDAATLQTASDDAAAGSKYFQQALDVFPQK